MRTNKVLITLLLAFLILGGVAVLLSETLQNNLARLLPQTTVSLGEALQNEFRDAEDKARDAGRKPVAVIEFLGISEGMTVLDIIAAGGYYTEVLSWAVGPKGQVYAQNPQVVLEYGDGINDKTLTERLADNRLPNVIRLDKEADALGLEANSIDFAVTALNFHDIYNNLGADGATDFARIIFTALKPGGGFGVIDHEGSADQNNVKLHRIQGVHAVEVLRAAGFEIEATSDLLRNPDDGMDKYVFDPAIRGATDRFLIRARKPA